MYRDLKKANWDKYHNLIENNLNNLENVTTDNFLELVNNAAEISIPFKQNSNNHKQACIWWDLECENQIKIRRETLKNSKENRIYKISLKPKE